VKTVPQPKLPQLNQFSIYAAGRYQNFSYDNGQVSSSMNFNYVLVPKSAGKFTIPPIEIQLDGKTYQTNPIEITIIASQAQAEPAPKDKFGNQKQQAQDLWIETSLDRDKAYVGQQVTLTLKFYQGVKLFQNPEYSPPSLSGFWTEDLPPQKRYYQTIGSRRYYVQEIKTALFPTTSGKKTIGAAELKCRVEDLDSFFGRDPFSLFDKDLSQLFSQGKPKVLHSQPLNLEVLSLPPGQPPGFSGAMGAFSLKTDLDKIGVEAGQPITLRITISGTGNIKSVTSPSLPELTGFRTYSSGSSENISKADYKLQGTKTFEQILIPKETGSFSISPIEFSYFDPVRKRYKTLRSQTYMLTVKPGRLQPLASGTSTTNEISPKIKDIHYLKTEIGQSSRGGFVFKNSFFLAMQSLPVLTILLLWRVEAHRQRLLNDRAYARFRMAYKNAETQLILAHKNLTSGQGKEYYGLLYKALSGYLADKLNLDSAAIFTDELISRLKKSPLSQSEIQRGSLILQECEQARFGRPSQDQSHKLRLLEETGTLLKNLEKYKWNSRAYSQTRVIS